MEQKKEIGILRSLGVTRFAIFRLFSYEAFVLILASSMLGVRPTSAIHTKYLFVRVF
jgi:ABC-type antimicrobial peptide transport system permease subunit